MMSFVCRLCLWVCVWSVPLGAAAAVSISEVAWMGTVESANHEWIELYNDGAATDVSGWIISDGNNLTIELSGVVPAQSYVLLERNRSSGAYIATQPFLIYTGALVNTGATLTMTDDTGAIVDRVADDATVEGWDIGGDNETKDTAQYTASGWGSGTPTPGASNVGTVTVSDDDDEPQTTRSNGAVVYGKTKPSTQLTVADAELQLRIELPEVVTVGQPARMRVTPSGLGKSLMDSLSWQWNFGDGAATSGSKTVNHTYDFPGTYVVTVRAAVGRHEQIAEQVITVVPTRFSITQSEAGDVQIHNDMQYAVDVSRYRVVGDLQVTLPERTILAPKSSITIPHQKILQEQGSDIALYNRLGNVVATWWPSMVAAAAVPVTATVASQLSSTGLLGVSSFSFASNNGSVVAPTSTEVVGEVIELSTSTSATTSTNTAAYLPYILLAVVIGFGIAGVLMVRSGVGGARQSIEPAPHSFFSPPDDMAVK